MATPMTSRLQVLRALVRECLESKDALPRDLVERLEAEEALAEAVEFVDMTEAVHLAARMSRGIEIYLESPGCNMRSRVTAMRKLAWSAGIYR